MLNQSQVCTAIDSNPGKLPVRYTMEAMYVLYCFHHNETPCAPFVSDATTPTATAVKSGYVLNKSR